MQNKMVTKGEGIPIETFVFTKIETTGRQWEDYLPTKIVELSFIAVNKKDLERGQAKSMPPALKMNMVFCPERYIQEEASNAHDLSVSYLENAPAFNRCAPIIATFLQQLPKPVCLVAHNGNAFDFKHLKKELMDAGVVLSEDLLYADSMRILCHVLKSEGELKIAKNMTVKLPTLYEMLFEEVIDATTAEDRALMTLDCALLKKEGFLQLVGQKCKLFSEVIPTPESRPRISLEIKNEF